MSLPQVPRHVSRAVSLRPSWTLPSNVGHDQLRSKVASAQLYSTLEYPYSLEEYLSSKLPELTTTSYAILGLLTLKPWSTYELAKQIQRDRFVWPRAESNLYAEPKKLIVHG